MQWNELRVCAVQACPETGIAFSNPTVEDWEGHRFLVKDVADPDPDFHDDSTRQANEAIDSGYLIELPYDEGRRPEAKPLHLVAVASFRFIEVLNRAGLYMGQEWTELPQGQAFRYMSIADLEEWKKQTALSIHEMVLGNYRHYQAERERLSIRDPMRYQLSLMEALHQVSYLVDRESELRRTTFFLKALAQREMSSLGRKQFKVLADLYNREYPSLNPIGVLLKGATRILKHGLKK